MRLLVLQGFVITGQIFIKFDFGNLLNFDDIFQLWLESDSRSEIWFGDLMHFCAHLVCSLACSV